MALLAAFQDGCLACPGLEKFKKDVICMILMAMYDVDIVVESAVLKWAKAVDRARSSTTSG